jgi:hypothetical protein
MATSHLLIHFCGQLSANVESEQHFFPELKLRQREEFLGNESCATETWGNHPHCTMSIMIEPPGISGQGF